MQQNADNTALSRAIKIFGNHNNSDSDTKDDINKEVPIKWQSNNVSNNAAATKCRNSNKKKKKKQ